MNTLTFFAASAKIILWPLTNVYSLTVSNSQGYSNNEFDRRPVYSGERFRALISFAYPIILTVVSFCCGGWYCSQILHKRAVLETDPSI